MSFKFKIFRFMMLFKFKISAPVRHPFLFPLHSTQVPDLLYAQNYAIKTRSEGLS